MSKLPKSKESRNFHVQNSRWEICLFFKNGYLFSSPRTPLRGWKNGVARVKWNGQLMDVVFFQFKRSSGGDSPDVRGPFNANKHSRYVELVLVVDNREFKELGEDLRVVNKHCKDIANIINAVSAFIKINRLGPNRFPNENKISPHCLTAATWLSGCALTVLRKTLLLKLWSCKVRTFISLR